MIQRRRVCRSSFLLLLAIITLVSLSYFPLSRTRAASVTATVLPSAGKPLVHLKNPQSLKVTYIGSSDAVGALQNGSAVPTALAAADFDADGAIDVVAGYSTGNGGVVALFRGNKDAFSPTNPALYPKAIRGSIAPTFLSKARVFSVPESPDLLATGDFNRDGFQDVLVGTKGSRNLYLLAGDGTGNLMPAQIVPLTGQVRALAVSPDDHVAVSLDNPNGSELAILSSSTGGLIAGATHPLPAPGDSIAWGNLGGGADIAVGAGKNIALIYNVLLAKPQTETVTAPFQVMGLALGDFIWDQEGRTEIAALADDGSVQILQHGVLNTAPLTAAQIPSRRKARAAKNAQPSNPTALGAWTVAKQLPYTGSAPASPVSASAFSSPHVAQSSTHDVMVLDAGRNQLNILDTSGKTASPSAAVSFSGTPVAALALPQKIDAARDIVVLTSAQSAPMVISADADPTFNVNTTADIDSVNACAQSSGVTTPPATLSLREAVCIANNNGASTVTINVPAGTYDLTISTFGGNGSAFSSGELQVGIQSGNNITISGAGAGSTIIQQANSTDRIIENDELLEGNQPLSIQNLTLQNGTCTDSGLDCLDNGGGAILAGGATGDTLTLTNVDFNHNSATSASGTLGGAVEYTGSSLSITGSTFSDNTASGTGGAEGGGVQVENIVNGLGVSGSVTITNSTFSGNSASGGNDGISNGGGLFFSGSAGFNGSVTGSTFTGNTASSTASTGAATGGGIDAEGGGTDTFSVSNSRIVGNSVSASSAVASGYYGLNLDGTITNDWWGCNGGPGASGCDTVFFDQSGGGTSTFTPWLVLSVSANPTQINANATSTLTADLTHNSGGTGGFSVPNGTPVSFGGTLDSSVNPGSTTLTSGQATSTYTAGSTSGTGSGTATVDHQEVSTPIDILVSVAVTTSPANLSITVDGTTYTAPQSFNWVVGSSHTLNTTSPQAGPSGSQYVWNSWSQGGTQSQSLDAPSSTTTYTANFTTQYQLTTQASPSADGSVAPTSGNYYNSGTVVPLTATANTGYSFSNWTGNVANSTSASTSITMTAPQSVTANFTVVIVATPTSTSVSSNNNPSFTSPPNNSVTFTATVTSDTTVNEGTVTFSDTANDFTCSGGNTVPVSNGQAACTTSFTTEGSRSVTANYNGTVNFQTSNGSITQTVNNHTVVNGNQFCNTGAITVPNTSGPATPYPSNIFVSGISGNISAVTVRLNNISSSDIAQTDLLLVGPTGAKIIPFASVGDGSTINGVNITLDDTASNLIPGGSPLTSGSYKPTSITGGTSLIFPAPAPLVNDSNYAATDGSATLSSTFSGTGPNGTWALYAIDNAGNGAAGIEGGWCVNVTASSAPAITSANSTNFTFNSYNTFTVTATGNPTPTFSESGALPNGVTLSTSGVLSGTPTQPGSFPITITASNGVSPNATQSFTLNVSQASTSIAITNVNPASEAYGQNASVTITAVLSWTGTGSSPTASDVTIGGNGPSSYGATTCGAPSGNTLTCTATYTPSAADTVGSYTESASFSGDSNYTGSASTQSNNFSITQATSSTSVGSSQNPSTLGQQVTFTATIDGEYGLVVRRNGEVVSGTPASKRALNQRKLPSVREVPALGITGTVSWSSNTGCSETPVSGDPATSQCVTTTLPQGNDVITATYSGDANHTGGSGTLSGGQQVNAAGTMTSLMSSKNPSDTGQDVTFTATVSSSGPTPTGTVKFLNGSKVLGSATLSGGVATLSTKTLPAGTDVITAMYEGSSTDSGGTSSPLDQVVLETTKTTLTSAENPAVVNQPITVTTTVSSTNGPPPDGEQVTFHWGSVLLGTGTLSGGSASITFSKTLPDTYSLTASYGGDSTFAPSSATLMEVVNKAPTTTMLMSSVNPSNSGQAVIFTITVAPEYSGTTPQGSVELKKGGIKIWEGTLTDGMAQVTISTLAAGNHTLSAAYTGGERFLNSTSAQLVQTVK
ncbi:MAG: Ig-like domain repeat protein [Candidatus Sulfotelmatobacter sp.]